MIAVGGSWGTLAEIGFAMRLGRPLVALGGPAVEGVPRASTPEEAVDAVLAAPPSFRPPATAAPGTAAPARCR